MNIIATMYFVQYFLQSIGVFLALLLIIGFFRKTLK